MHKRGIQCYVVQRASDEEARLCILGLAMKWWWWWWWWWWRSVCVCVGGGSHHNKRAILWQRVERRVSDAHLAQQRLQADSHGFVGMATRRCTVLEGNWAELEAKSFTRDTIAVTNDHSELLHLAFLDEWLE
jgi:hypothetical protein